MKLPADLNPVINQRLLSGGTPVWDVTVTVNGHEHTYTTAEISDFAAMQILLKAMDDGYGKAWEHVADDSAVVPLPQLPPPEQSPVTPAVEAISE